MKESGKIFAYNTTPCVKFGHTIRERSGHCIICDKARISFMLRHVSFGTIYLAGSIKGELIKIGTTNNITNRIKALNREKYGKQNDWIVLFQFDCINAGEIEFGIQDTLKPYAATDLLYRENQESTELLRCSFEKAIEASLYTQVKLAFIAMNTKRNAVEVLANYNFRNLRKT